MKNDPEEYYKRLRKFRQERFDDSLKSIKFQATELKLKGFFPKRRRLPETLPLNPEARAQACVAPSCLWIMVLLAVAFLVYWFVVRRFTRPRKRRVRDSLR